jgi:serine/threonine-protein kinase
VQTLWVYSSVAGDVRPDSAGKILSRSSSSRLPSVRALGGFKLHGASLLVFVLGAIISLNLFATLRTRARSRERLEFQRRVDDVASGLRSQLERPLEVLESVCGLFDASVDVGREEFARFARPALARHPSVRALEWIPLVHAAERPTYEKAARDDGLPAFEFRELAADGALVRANVRAEHLPIYFMEPSDDRVLGFDLTADSARRAPVDRAQTTRATVASERIRLIEDPPTTYSIAAFCPVFVPGRVGEPERLRGAGAEVFRMHEVVWPAITSAVKLGMQLIVIDLGAPAETRVLFESVAGLADRGQDETAEPADVRMDFADREWSLSFSRGPRYRSEGNEPLWGILFTGIMLSALFAVALSAARIILHLRGQVRAAQRLGQYTLIRKLGEGGMGMVWEARHALLRRPTAIKLLRPEHLGAEAIARFEREVQLTSQLTHPNTVAIYDYGRTAGGVFYYVMEYLDGLDLQRLVAFDGPQQPARVVHILKQVASALAEAHGRGLVHRDVKPANIVLCERGGLHDVAKVVDFGLVKRAAQQNSTLSMDHVVLGTPLFLAPEAIAHPEHVDGRSDLYACGAVAYFLLTGQAVFGGSTLVEVCGHHMYTQPQPPSARLRHALPARLERLVLRCLAKQPDDRFENAAALVTALSECGVPVWTDGEAELAWKRVAGHRDAQTATARTIAIDSPSALAIDLGRRSSPEQR